MKRLIILSALIAAFYWHWIAGMIASITIVVWSWFRAENHGINDELITERYRHLQDQEKSKVMVDDDGEIDWDV